MLKKITVTLVAAMLSFSCLTQGFCGDSPPQPTSPAPSAHSNQRDSFVPMDIEDSIEDQKKDERENKLQNERVKNSKRPRAEKDSKESTNSATRSPERTKKSKKSRKGPRPERVIRPKTADFETELEELFMEIKRLPTPEEVNTFAEDTQERQWPGLTELQINDWMRSRMNLKPLDFLEHLEGLCARTKGYPTREEKEEFLELTKEAKWPGLTSEQLDNWFRTRRRVTPKRKGSKRSETTPAFTCSCASGIQLWQPKAIQRHKDTCPTYQAKKAASSEDTSSSFVSSSAPSSSSVSSSSLSSTSQVNPPQKSKPIRKSAKRKTTKTAESSTLSSSNQDEDSDVKSNLPKKRRRASATRASTKKPKKSQKKTSTSFKCDNCGKQIRQSNQKAIAYHKVVCESAKGSEKAPEPSSEGIQSPQSTSSVTSQTLPPPASSTSSSTSISASAPVADDFELSNLGITAPPLGDLLDILNSAPAQAGEAQSSVHQNDGSDGEFEGDLAPAELDDTLLGRETSVPRSPFPTDPTDQNYTAGDTEPDTDSEEQAQVSRTNESSSLSGTRSPIAQSSTNNNDSDLVLEFELDEPEYPSPKSPALAPTVETQPIAQPPTLISPQSASIVPSQTSMSPPASATSSSTLRRAPPSVSQDTDSIQSQPQTLMSSLASATSSSLIRPTPINSASSSAFSAVPNNEEIVKKQKDAPSESVSSSPARTEVAKSAVQPQPAPIVPLQASISPPASTGSSVARDQVNVKIEGSDPEVLFLGMRSNDSFFSALGGPSRSATSAPQSMSSQSQSDSEFLFNMLALCTDRITQLTKSLIANPASCADTLKALENAQNLQSQLTQQLKATTTKTSASR